MERLSQIMARAFLGLGSNLGDRQTLIEEALRLLSYQVGRLVATSRYYETHPAGGPPGQPQFLNAVALVETSLQPYSLLQSCRQIENRLGRVRAVRWEPRTIDIDILLYDELFLKTADLEIPHPRLAVRRFVLEPLAEIAPWAMHPLFSKPVGELWRHIQETSRLCWLISIGSSCLVWSEWKRQLQDLAIVLHGHLDRPGSGELAHGGRQQQDWTCVLYAVEGEPGAGSVQEVELLARKLAAQRHAIGTPRVVFFTTGRPGAGEQVVGPWDTALAGCLTQVGLVPWLRLGPHAAQACDEVRAALTALS